MDGIEKELSKLVLEAFFNINTFIVTLCILNLAIIIYSKIQCIKAPYE